VSHIYPAYIALIFFHDLVKLKITTVLLEHKYTKTVSCAISVLSVGGLVNYYYTSRSSSWQPCKPLYQCTNGTLPINSFWIKFNLYVHL